MQSFQDLERHGTSGELVIVFHGYARAGERMASVREVIALAAATSRSTARKADKTLFATSRRRYSWNLTKLLLPCRPATCSK
jgi:hypothetical protein